MDEAGRGGKGASFVSPKQGRDYLLFTLKASIPYLSREWERVVNAFTHTFPLVPYIGIPFCLCRLAAPLRMQMRRAKPGFAPLLGKVKLGALKRC